MVSSRPGSLFLCVAVMAGERAGQAPLPLAVRPGPELAKVLRVEAHHLEEQVAFLIGAVVGGYDLADSRRFPSVHRTDLAADRLAPSYLSLPLRSGAVV